jgi:hypothetical protein
MTQEQQAILKEFINSIADVPWLSRAGEPESEAIVVPDIVVGWDDWNDETLEVWLPRSKELEKAAQEQLGDEGIDVIFATVSTSISQTVYDGLMAYFARRPEDATENTEAAVDQGLWPELLDTIKRDMCWAAVEAILKRKGFFTMLVQYYRAGRWPCSWQGSYPAGQIVLL